MDPANEQDNAAPSFSKMVAAAMTDSPVESTPGFDAVAPAVHEQATSAPEVVSEAAQEQVETPSGISDAFAAYLQSKGLDVGDTDPVSLHESAYERIVAGTQALSELETLRARLAQLEQSQAAPQYSQQASQTSLPPPAAVAEAVKATEQRIFQELKRYDSSLEQYITRDGNGQAVAKAEWGREAIDAANAINAYDRMEREQAARLLQNPNLLFQDNKSEFERIAEEKALKTVRAELEAWKAEQAKSTQEQAAAQVASEYERRANEWHMANKASLFKLGPDGEPMGEMFDKSKPATTPLGKAFFQEYHALQAEMTGVSNLVLMSKALQYAKLAVPQAAPKPVPPAQQRAALFAQQRASVPNQSVTPASASELEAERPSRLRFADMARFNPDNAEVISGWK